MIDVLDLTKIVSAEMIAVMSEEIADPILRNIAEGARDKWVQLAAREFRTTRQDYIEGLQPVVFGKGQAVISLVGVLPNLLENGMDATDMHETLLGSSVPVVPKGQRGKHMAEDGGVYRAIPFRHSTPGASGALAQAMGRVSGNFKDSAAGKRLSELATSVYKQAKKLEPTKTDPYGNVIRGGSLDTSSLDIPLLASHHSTDIYSGMIKSQKFYRSSVQNQYVTFRMISVDKEGKPRGANGDQKWLRPATQGAHLREKVAAYVRRIAPGAIAAYVEGLK